MSQDELQKFINLISRLPGIGQRSAQRIALYLIKNKQELMLPLGESIAETASVVKKCTNCGILDVVILAYGVPVGSESHYLDDNTLGAALESRKNLS